MENNVFKIQLDEALGGVTQLSILDDVWQMNFVKAPRALGALRSFVVEKLEQTQDSAVFTLKKDNVQAVTKFTFDGDRLCVSHTLTNEGCAPVYFKEGDIALEMPFNDRYESSEVCIRERCHAHIFAGEDCSYILAERMGESEHNLGLVFTQGRITSYSQEETWHSNRGFFLLNVEPFCLLKGESYPIAYSIFTHKGGEDFYQKAKQFSHFLHVVAPNGYTFELGKSIRFFVEASKDILEASCLCGKENIPVKIEGNKAFIEYLPTCTGEKRMNFTIDGVCSHAMFNVVLPPDTLIERRLDFIVNKQQCTDKNSPLYGAYLIYDNQEQRQFFYEKIRDYNACRERFGMAILIAKYLQKHPNENFMNSLNLFIEFMFRECVEETTGEVFDGIGKRAEFLRLYNAPWVTLFATEMYKLTGAKRWLELIVKTIEYYYSVGGAKFYPNGIRFYDFFQVLKESGEQGSCERILSLFDEHIANIVKNGVIYPPHEVNFEQTIVTPAVTLLLDKYQISGEQKYLLEAEKHLRILKKFNGAQPDYHLNKIPVRFWDGYWFGKTRNYGDTFPHYWSVLSGYCFWTHGKLTGDKEEMKQGVECIENCTCMFKDDGSASCAYVYPKFVNGVRGAYFDAFANDQDFSLYFLLKVHEE